jgi:hypothetical protein
MHTGDAQGLTGHATMHTATTTRHQVRWTGPAAAVAALLILSLTTPSMAVAKGGKPPKIDRALAKIVDQGGEAVPVIVRTKPGKLDSFTSKVRKSGKAHRASLPSVDGVVLELSAEEIVRLAEDGDVTSLSLDAEVGTSGDDSLDTPGAPVSHAALRATLGLAGYTGTGAGIGVAIVDSGIAQDAGLKATVAAFRVENGRVKSARPSTPTVTAHTWPASARPIRATPRASSPALRPRRG